MKRALKRFVPFLLVIGIILSIGWYLLVYDREFTRDVLLSQARYHDTKGNNNAASFFYDLAYDYTGQEEGVAIELANQYKSDGNYTKAEYTLTNAIADGGTAELYIALCKTYVEQDKLLDAVNMLDNIADPAIRAELEALRPTAPTADNVPGFYSQYIPVTISSNAGTLYCTVDGEYPSIQDTPYSEPIVLPAGETTIYALSVADNGLVSPLTILGYTVGGVIEEAVFADPAMEASVRQLLGAEEDDVLMTDQLWNITEFTVPAETGVFDDLALLPYVESLTIEGKTFDSLSCLAGLTDLAELKLIGCRFPAESLTTLTTLPSLQRLTLSDCGLSTIADLAGAPQLTYLDLSHNTLRNLEPLSGMSFLTEINLQHNAVTDLSALASLSNLEKLDVSYNSLTSLAPIESCQKLSWLNANNNSISRLSAVNKLPALTYLALDHNQISDITLLGECTGLTELSISNNAVTDLTALSTLTALEKLDFSHNEVVHLAPWYSGGSLISIDGSYNKVINIDILVYMENLTYVYMDYNELTNIDALANCYHLVTVNVYGNQIPDVSALTDHNIIVNYDPS